MSCANKKPSEKAIKEEKPKKVKLMTLDPGHFHAALVKKTMYDQVDPNIYVFAPEGPEVNDFLSKIASYNSRENSLPKTAAV